MKVLLKHDYRGNKKEPFGQMLRRLHDGLVQAGLPVSYQFSFADMPVGGGVSAVKRAVKKFPQLTALVQSTTALQAITGTDADLPFDVLAEVADALPRSLPFHAVNVRFTGPAFGSGGCGMAATDNWWVNGRTRTMSVSYLFDLPESKRSLPAPEGPLAALLATLGKPSKTNQYSAPDNEAPRTALIELVQRIRARLGELVAEAAMPHSLPSLEEALKTLGHEPHPLKPTLERYFGPLGYSCKGGAGTFSLRRRTAGNHVVEIALDVGTWSHSVTAFFRVHVPGYHCSFSMPVAPGLGAGQYPISDAGRWEQIVVNLSVLTAHLDRHIVPEITAAAGPTPEWFEAPA